MSTVLLLEFDHTRLAREGHTQVGDRVATFLSGQSAVLVRRGLRSLGDLRGIVRAENRPFGAVVVVGHADPGGIQVGPGEAADWATVGAELAPLSPRVGVLVACNAGFSMATGTLFDAMESLEVIYAAPAPVTRNQTIVALLRAWQDTCGAPQADIAPLMQFVDYVTTGSAFLRRTRFQHYTQDPFERLLEDAFVAYAAAQHRESTAPPRPRQRRTRRRRSLYA